MKIDFTGKKAIVCGGSRGIGKAIALGIAEAGGDVSICARDVAILERIMREIRRCTRVVGAFPDGNSALNLAAARLRHIAGTRWSTKRYLNMQLLRQRNAMIA